MGAGGTRRSAYLFTPIHQLYVLSPLKLTFIIPNSRSLPIQSLDFETQKHFLCFSAPSYLPSIPGGLALPRVSRTARFQATLSLPHPRAMPPPREPLTTHHHLPGCPGDNGKGFNKGSRQYPSLGTLGCESWGWGIGGWGVDRLPLLGPYDSSGIL